MYQAKMPEKSSRCINVVPSGVTFDSVKLNEWVPVTRPYQRNSVEGLYYRGLVVVLEKARKGKGKGKKGKGKPVPEWSG